MSNIAEAGLRELVLDRVVVTEDGGLCTRTEQVELNTLKTSEQQKDARKVKAYKDEPLLTRIPDKIMLIGKTSGVCQWENGETTKEIEDQSKLNFTASTTAETLGIFKGGVYNTFKSAEIRTSGGVIVKKRGDIPALTDVMSFRKTFRMFTLSEEKCDAFDKFAKTCVPRAILNPLKTEGEYTSMTVVDAAESSGCSGWTVGAKKYILTRIVNSDEIMPEFYGSSEFSNEDRDAAILLLKSSEYRKYCSDKIGYFLKKDNGLYYYRFQDGYDIHHCRFGKELPHLLVDSSDGSDCVGPIWAGDSLTLKTSSTILKTVIVFLFS